MASNHVSAVLGAEDVQAVFAAIATIREKLPFLIDLSVQDRRSLPKMGDRSRAFVEKTLEVAKQNPDFLSRSFDLEEFERDVLLHREMNRINMALAQLHELVDDTTLATGSDAYTASLEAYAFAKAVGKGDGLDQMRALMSQRFSRNSGQSSPAPEAPAA